MPDIIIDPKNETDSEVSFLDKAIAGLSNLMKNKAVSDTRDIHVFL